MRRAVAEVRSPIVPVLTGRGVADLGPADAVWLPVESERRLTLRATLLVFVRRLEETPRLDEGADPTENHGWHDGLPPVP